MVQATFARVVNADFADGVRAHLCHGIGDFLLARSPRIQTHTEVSCVFNQIFLCKLLFIRIHVGIPNPFLGVWMLRVDQLLLQLLMLPQLVSVCCTQFRSSNTKATSNLMCKSCRITSPKHANYFNKYKKKPSSVWSNGAHQR